MQENNKFNKIKLENNNLYYVINTIILDEHEYCYLINENNISDIIICEMLNIDMIRIVTEQKLLFRIINNIYNQKSFFLD